MRWLFIILLMCNGIYFLWQAYLVREPLPVVAATDTFAGPDVPQLRLLSEDQDITVELAGDEVGARAQPERAAEPPPEEIPEPEQPSICWQIGPFKEEVSGKMVVSRLAALDIHLKLFPVEIADKPDYWVHIPPQLSRREATKLLRELQSKKIDSFLITEGDLENGISLGFFTQEDRAEKVLAERQKQGYGAAIKKVPRTHTELWAVFNEDEHGPFSDSLWEKITEGNQGLERRKNYCDKIASAGNID